MDGGIGCEGMDSSNAVGGEIGDSIVEIGE